MKKEAKGKPEQQKRQAGRRIPIGMFSTQRWPVQMKLPSVANADEERDFSAVSLRVAPLCSRELNLGVLFTAAYQKLAA